MFFIGIFGIESKEKKIKDLHNIFCKACNREEPGQLIKTYNYFHFFFLPIFKWSESYYVLCSNCSTLYEISKEKGKSIERGEDYSLTYWDLREINRGNSIKVCKYCNQKVEDNFLFCPYCGERLE